MRVPAFAVIALCALRAPVGGGQALQPVSHPVGLLGVNAGMLTDGSPGPFIPTYGMQWTRVQCRPICEDVAVGVSPGGGAGMRLGLTAPLAAGANAFILPSAGLSGVVGPSWGNTTAASGGAFAGVSAVVGIDWGVALRAEATLHWIVPLTFPVYLLEAGLTVPL